MGVVLTNGDGGLPGDSLLKWRENDITVDTGLAKAHDDDPKDCDP